MGNDGGDRVNTICNTQLLLLGPVVAEMDIDRSHLKAPLSTLCLLSSKINLYTLNRRQIMHLTYASHCLAAAAAAAARFSGVMQR